MIRVAHPNPFFNFAFSSVWDRQNDLDTSFTEKDSPNSGLDAEPLSAKREISSPNQIDNLVHRRAFSPTDPVDLQESFDKSTYDSDNEDILHRSNQEEEPDYIESQKLNSSSRDSDYDFDSGGIKPNNIEDRPSLFAKRTAGSADHVAKSPQKRHGEDNDGDDYGEDFEEEDEEAEEVASEVGEEEVDDVSVGGQVVAPLRNAFYAYCLINCILGS